MQRLLTVEVNSSPYMPHRPPTYSRWAAEMPERFALASEVPWIGTHRRPVDDEEALATSWPRHAREWPGETHSRCNCHRILASGAGTNDSFSAVLDHRYGGTVACENRHRSCFTPEAVWLLAEREVAEAAADPTVVSQASHPIAREGGTAGSRT